MTVDLVPTKRLMRTAKNMGISVVIVTVILLLLMHLRGITEDLATSIALSFMSLMITLPIPIPGLIHDRVSQSVVRFDTSQIQVLDKRGTCWRSIDYNAITAVQVRDVSGFFYGEDKDKFCSKYVCVFLGGTTTIPDDSYAKLFKNPDFFMFGYHPEAVEILRQKCALVIFDN